MSTLIISKYREHYFKNTEYKDLKFNSNSDKNDSVKNKIKMNDAYSSYSDKND